MKAKAMGDPERSRDNNYYEVTIFLYEVHQDVHPGDTLGNRKKMNPMPYPKVSTIPSSGCQGPSVNIKHWKLAKTRSLTNYLIQDAWEWKRHNI